MEKICYFKAALIENPDKKYAGTIKGIKAYIDWELIWTLVNNPDTDLDTLKEQLEKILYIWGLKLLELSEDTNN